MDNKITIGVTHADIKHENYIQWLKGNDENIEIIDLTAEKQNWDEIEDCDGIVLSGGVDIFPLFYDNDRIDYPNPPKEFNEARDVFEMHVFETALNFDHPVLAICRGMQLVNVSLGGDMTQDLVEAGKNDHTHISDTEDRQHHVTVIENSLLHEVTNLASGTINSSHHQGIKNLSEELMVSAISADGVIEGIEWKVKEGEPWLLAVQWHPERMKDGDITPFSKNIREKFLEAVKKNKNAGSQPSH